MKFKLEKIEYLKLSSVHQENYNFQKLAAILADYGYNCKKFKKEVGGADFFAVHVDGKTTYKIQLKGRMEFNRIYEGKDIWIAFPDGNDWYLYPHDEMLKLALANDVIPQKTLTYAESGQYSFLSFTKKANHLIQNYKILKT